MAGSSIFQVDPAGDLNLLVKHHGQDKIFQVSSKVMSLASPVWRTMLDPSGPFREAKPDIGEIAFPEDDAEALLIVLLAAHLCYQEVPQSGVGYKQLLEICIVCDKYDCIQLMRPWISNWEVSLATFADKDTYEEWLFIAWTTGDRATFERIARKLAFESTIGSFPRRCLTESDKELGENMPPGIVGQSRIRIPLFHYYLTHGYQSLLSCLMTYRTVIVTDSAEQTVYSKPVTKLLFSCSSCVIR